ncbi:ABC transporter ATP-binding protein [Sellimonas catena]|uniref:ABC transporter ATP-binding protein n=1 Tax=Sellimonas catena TaxID=2994035 RepID=A0A9W6CA63_9FIRM|nr:ABC transporter ATP-binding protein [Sellimonas catena]GLG89611.1 ABC transporter ATP-binding protein [Sellimonas catena]
MYVLEVENLIRNYQKAVGKKGKEDIKVLKGLNFQVEEGDFTGIMGKSGCGKTTLLKVLGMIDKQTDGTIRFMGQDTKGLSGDTLADIRRTKLGFIFQDYYLMDSLTVEENIMLPMILGQEDAQKMMDAAKAYAEKFQIDHLLNKNPYELSGGEKQRVAICRALINNPDLILADEPTGNLDSKSGKIVIEALRTINQEMKKTIVMVTHDPQMASNCRKIILLKDGVILETLERGEKSQEEFYQEIIGKMEEL